MMNLSQVVAEHIAATRFSQLSAKAVTMTKYSIIDALGVMQGASGLGEGCDAFAQLVIESQSKPQATLFGYGTRAATAQAALVNGALAHALDFEDAHDSAPVHPNAQVIPAVLALAETHGEFSGRDVITAIAVGCDLVCRLGMSLEGSMDDFGWYSPPILSTFGATAAAANLMHLTPRQTLDALSMALCQTSCSSEIKFNPESVMRSIRDAFPTQVAIQSVQLAQKGIRGFDQPLDGKAGFINNFARNRFNGATLTNELGHRFEGENLSFKPWPACRGTHPYIDCALQMRERYGLDARNIVRGHMRGHKVQHMLYEPQATKRQPATAIDAKFSIPFTVAAALLYGDVTLNTYHATALKDAHILELAQRLTFEVDSDPRASDNATRGELTLTMSSGDVYTMAIEHPRGHSSRPMSEAQLIEKFNQCSAFARHKVSAHQREQLLAFLMTLESLPQVGDDVFALLR